jgi:peptidoglycan/xylan/chitin deacetylase (PgdA/CDA1 family)
MPTAPRPLMGEVRSFAFATLAVLLGGCNDGEGAPAAAPPPPTVPGPYFSEVVAHAPTDADPRAVLPAPTLSLTAAGRTRFAPLPVRPGTVPVLLFHQVCEKVCGPDSTYGVTQADLMKMLLAVESAGFTTIPIDAYVRAMKGNLAGLPERPILVTFDDGRLDAYRGADDVLRALDAKATMYILTAELARASAFRMSVAEMEVAKDSGRWDIQLHAHAGHVLIEASVDDAGAPTFMPFYASRRRRSQALEPFLAWKARATEDLAEGKALVAGYFGGYEYASLTFAVPYGNFGQTQTNDPAIAPDLRAMLDARFDVWFTQPGDPDFSGPPGEPSPTHTHEAGRFTVRRETTAETLYAWLARHSSPPR